MADSSIFEAPYVTTVQLASMWGTNLKTIMQYAKRMNDPLPVRYIRGKVRGGFVSMRELNAWVERNTVMHGERVEDALCES